MRLLLVALFFLLLPTALQGQTMVEDKNKRKQVERMVFIRWNKFDPSWWFSIKHGKYKRAKDKRIMKQLLPALAALKTNSEETENEKDDISDVHDYHVAQQANIIAESHFHLHYKPVFNELDDYYDNLYQLAIDNGVSIGDLSVFDSERTMLHEYLEAVRDGNIVKGESAEAMEEIQSDYEKLLSVMARTISVYMTKNRFLLIKKD